MGADDNTVARAALARLHREDAEHFHALAHHLSGQGLAADAAEAQDAAERAARLARHYSA